jgi:hypothetical protein
MSRHSHRRIHPHARVRRLALAAVPAATLAVSLAACSGSGGGASNHPGHHAAAAAATTAASPVGTSTSAPAATTPAAGALSGTWNGQYGGSYQGTFVLHWRQSGPNLNGSISISAPAATLSIHGRLAGSAIQFGTVGSYQITYSGTVSGTSMSGTYQVDGSQGGTWTASQS